MKLCLVFVKTNAILLLLTTAFFTMLIVADSPVTSCLSACRNPKTTFVPRSQGTNGARTLAGVQSFLNTDDMSTAYGIVSITPAYTKSLKPDAITDYFFGKAARDGMVTITGSAIVKRNQETDILADYFGLPRNFKSCITFNPHIENILVDIDWYYGLDTLCKNLFLLVHFPIVHTRWSLNAHEKVIAAGTDVPPGYFTKTGIARKDLPKGALDRLQGTATFGDAQQKVTFGKISCQTEKETAIADIHCTLGWNFCCTDTAHWNIGVKGVIPTGTRPNAEFLFEPIVGNGRHFELGATTNSHLVVWDNKEDRFLALYADLTITHQLSTQQVRSFDFETNDAGSRYILVAEYKPIPREENGDPISGHLSTVGTNNEYAQKLLPAVNLTSLCCQVSTQLQADAVLQLSYYRSNVTWDIGYNLWGRTKEKVKLNDEIANDRFALKGDAYLFGVAVDTQNPQAADVTAARSSYPTNAIALSATQEQSATLFTGGNNNKRQNPSLISPELNPGIDNPEKAFARLNGNDRPVFSPVTDASTQTPIKSSSFVEFIGETINIDTDSAAAPSALTHKIYTHFHYTWQRSNSRFVPFLGFGAEIELSRTQQAFKHRPCECRPALNQWGVWLKVGGAY